MASGGARARNHTPDENSARSIARGFTLTALPATGYDGEAPDFPLPEATERELEVWTLAWLTPQACAWAAEPWRWRSVAMWVRWSVRMEAEDASAALGNVVMRYADDIGMTAAGLKLNGWKVADAPKQTPPTEAPADAVVTDMQSWLSGGA